MIRYAALNHELAKNLEHVLAVQPTLHSYCKTFTRALVDDGEHTELTAVSCSILDKVISRDGEACY